MNKLVNQTKFIWNLDTERIWTDAQDVLLIL